MIHYYKADLIDAESAAKLINAAYRGDSSRQGWTTEADILDGLRTTTKEVAKIINGEQSFMVIGVVRDEIVATISCEWEALAGHNTARFGLIAVKPTLQNKGYGKQIIQAAEAMTKRAWRVVGYHMSVISIREELIAFYERQGYERTGETQAFPEQSDLWQPKVEGLTLQYLAKLIEGK